MGKIVATKTYLIPTELGSFTVTNRLYTEFDVENVISNRAESQARVIQMINLGKELEGNPEFPPEVLPSIFVDNNDELEDL